MDKAPIEATLILREDEGVRFKPYRDTVGKLSIGVGRNLDDVGLSPDEVEYLFQNDWRRARKAVLTAWPWVVLMTEPRQAVMAMMAFNMGIGRLRTFTKTLAAAEAGRYDVAASEMLNSKWAREDVAPSRSSRMAQMMRSGQWPT